MKSLKIIPLFLLLTLQTQAQWAKGSYQLAVRTNSSMALNADIYYSRLNFNPEFAYFFGERVALGVQANFQFAQLPMSPLLSSKQTAFSVSPFIRYQMPLKNRWSLNFDAGFGLGYASNEASAIDKASLLANFAIGANYKLNERFSLSLNYHYSTGIYQNSSALVFNTSPYINYNPSGLFFGIHYYFNRKGKRNK